MKKSRIVVPALLAAGAYLGFAAELSDHDIEASFSRWGADFSVNCDDLHTVVVGPKDTIDRQISQGVEFTGNTTELPHGAVAELATIAIDGFNGYQAGSDHKIGSTYRMPETCDIDVK